MMVPRFLVPSLLLVAAPLAGCSSSSAASAPGGGSPAVESLAAIQKDILTPTCATGGTCHGPGDNGPPTGFQVYGAMDGTVSSHAVYTAIVNKPSVDAPTLTLVVPGDPQKSFLIAKLTAKTSGGFKGTACDPAPTGNATCGTPMPMTGGSLTTEQFTRIENWIMQGALDN